MIWIIAASILKFQIYTVPNINTSTAVNALMNVYFSVNVSYMYLKVLIMEWLFEWYSVH